MSKFISAERPIWWSSKITQLLELSKIHRNAIVYDMDTIIGNVNSLFEQDAFDEVFYAMKANYNSSVLKNLANKNIGFECVSPGEVKHLLDVLPYIDATKILFTPNFSPKEDYIFALNSNLMITVDSLYPLKAWPNIFSNKKIMLRIDLGIGDGHHEHVNTGGDSSKFGITLDKLAEIQIIANAHNISIVGLHTHSGSGILNVLNWVNIANKLIEIANTIPSVTILNLGGGIPIREKLSDNPFDLGQLNTLLLDLKRKYSKYEFWLEPGRYIVGEAGVILTKVTQLKEKGGNYYIGVEIGMNTLIRPALYDAYHEIINLSRYREPITNNATIVGPICESGDRLGNNREFPSTIEGDTILIASAGAYVRSMASNYNLREIPKEIII